MRLASEPKDPASLSYHDMRRAVGIIAVALPFALAIPWLLCRCAAQSSISGYYYTGMRNLFVGSLCAIAMFMICCKGYDDVDTIADIFSGICALGVAFLPTAPVGTATQCQKDIGRIHWGCAALLFLTLAWFCFWQFTKGVEEPKRTRRKKHRNRVYYFCGGVILFSIVMIAILNCRGIERLWGIGSDFVFETTALLAFGLAWLVKGETFLKDDPPAPQPTGEPAATS